MPGPLLNQETEEGKCEWLLGEAICREETPPRASQLSRERPGTPSPARPGAAPASRCLAWVTPTWEPLPSTWWGIHAGLAGRDERDELTGIFLPSPLTVSQSPRRAGAAAPERLGWCGETSKGRMLSAPRGMIGWCVEPRVPLRRKTPGAKL